VLRWQDDIPVTEAPVVVSAPAAFTVTSIAAFELRLAAGTVANPSPGNTTLCYQLESDGVVLVPRRLVRDSPVSGGEVVALETLPVAITKDRSYVGCTSSVCTCQLGS
jgi:hypothetical protein